MVRVWDEDTFSNDAVGFGVIKVSQLCFNGGQDHHYPIYWDGKKAGSVRLITQFHDGERQGLIERIHDIQSLINEEKMRANNQMMQMKEAEANSLSLQLTEVDPEFKLHAVILANGEAFDGESCQHVIDYAEGSKWCTKWEEDKLYIQFNFKRPVSVSGYGFTSANDRLFRCPGKWGITCFTDSGNYIRHENVGSNFWEEPFTLKRFDLDTRVTCDRIRIEFS